MGFKTSELLEARYNFSRNLYLSGRSFMREPLAHRIDEQFHAKPYDRVTTAD